MKTAAERFWAKVDLDGPNGCWLWTAKKTPGKHAGYGVFAITAHVQPMAHRYAYELLVGPVPEGLVLDHLCRVRNCVNPVHLEPVTQRENIMRQLNTGTETHCPHGHEFTPENTYVAPKGYRQCRECKTAATRRFNAAHPNRMKDWREGRKAS